MRCWRMTDGRLLAEERAGVYHVLTPDGRLERTFQDGSSSEREHLYTTTYVVEGSELRSTFVDDNTDVDTAKPKVSVEVIFSGLVPAEHPGIGKQVAAAQAAEKVRGRRVASQEAEKLAAFERSLPEFKGQKDLAFVFSYDAEEAIVVRGPGGVELWKETDCRVHGKYRFAEIRKILRRRYQKRLRSFTADLPDMKSGMAFNPE